MTRSARILPFRSRQPEPVYRHEPICWWCWGLSLLGGVSIWAGLLWLAVR